MTENLFAYIPPKDQKHDLPLERFLPDFPEGSVGEWLHVHVPPGSLIIDPIGANPALPMEGALNGYRVLLARNNPILWLMLEVLSKAYTENKYKEVLAKLLITRSEDKTLEDLLRSFYLSPCQNCRKMIQVDGYVWEKGGIYPIKRVYACPECGDEGEREICDHDRQILDQVGNVRIHEFRAQQRVMVGGEYELASIKNALKCYSPRALLVIMTLVNRLDGMSLTKPERRLLQALLLSVFDEGNLLWHWPIRDYHFLQLSVPNTFLEKNLWLALENAPQQWEQYTTRIPIQYWPHQPDSEGGISLYQRRLSESQNIFKEKLPAAVVTIFPRPNQAFWTLSALWSGWLWGRKGVLPMRSALARRRYDWDWFAQAIHATLKPIASKIDEHTPLFGILPDASPNFVCGLFTGCQTAGFKLQGAAFQDSQEMLQGLWKSGLEIKPKIIDKKEAIVSLLENYGEPASFRDLLIGCLIRIALNNGFPENISTLEETFFSGFQEEVATNLRDENVGISYKSNLAGGSRWWLVEDSTAQKPLSEKVEAFIRQNLIQNSIIDQYALEREIYTVFQGDLSPDRSLITTCLSSYADFIPGDISRWRIRSEETESSRSKDVDEIRGLLCSCGHQLGFRVKERDAVIWESDQQERYVYQIEISGIISEILRKSFPSASTIKVLVFPGSRSNWLVFRFQRDPHLAESMESGWHFLKFRYLRWLATRENLTASRWKDLLDGDPPLWDPPSQLPMF
jgi:hypothetical protein